MEDPGDFSHSLQALERLTEDLKCSKCTIFSDDLYTMGVCEHMLCRICSQINLGQDCPVCGLPTFVKDAQCNRQLSNMVRLCEELQGLLTGDISSEEENAYLTAATTSKVLEPEPLSVYDYTGTPVEEDVLTKRQVDSPVNYVEIDSQSQTTEEELEAGEVKCTPEEVKNILNPQELEAGEVSVPPHLKHTKLKSKSSNGLRQTTMTQLFEGVSPISVKNIKKTRKKRSSLPKTTQTTPANTKPVAPKRTPKGNNSVKQGRQSLGMPTDTYMRLLSPGTPTQSGKRQTGPHLKRNTKGETPLHISVIKGEVERVRSLLDLGANPNIRDHAGWTPLHEACNHGYTEIAELLLNNGALINTPGMENDSPLHDAVSNNRLECVRLLVSRGASQSARIFVHKEANKYYQDQLIQAALARVTRGFPDSPSLDRNVHGHTVRDLWMSEDVRNILETESIRRDHSYSSPPKKSTPEPNHFAPVVLLSTALSRDQKVTLQKAASLLKGQVIDEFQPGVSHVITLCNKEGQCPRTIKYLMSILTGKWILTMDWIETCLEYKSRVSEEAFEVTGSTPNPDTNAPTRGRLNELNQLPRLFDGCKFYFSGSFEPPTPELTDLIQLVRSGGGTILSRGPKLHTIDESSLTVPYHVDPESSLANCGIFIVIDNKADFRPMRTPHMCTVTVSWIMDSIASFKILDLPENNS